MRSKDRPQARLMARMFLDANYPTFAFIERKKKFMLLACVNPWRISRAFHYRKFTLNRFLKTLPLMCANLARKVENDA